MPGPGVFPGMGDNVRFPGRRGRRPLRGWLPVDGRPRELAAGCGHSLMGRSVGRGLDPSAGVCGRHGACPPPRGGGRACPARGFSRGWAVMGGFPGRRGRRPLRGCLPVDGLPRELAAGCGHSLVGRFVGRGLDPSAGVCGRQGACPPPRGRGRACPARRFSRGWAVTGGFRGVGDAAPYVGGCLLTGCRANLRRGVGTPPYGCNSRKRGRGRACPARRFPREWAVMGDFRGVGDAAPYVGGCPLTGGYANLRRGVGTPPYGCNSRKRGRGGS